MKNSKKLLALVLALVLALTITACSKGGNKPAGDDTSAAADTTALSSSEEIKVEGLTKEQFDKMTADDLLTHVENLKKVTLEEYEWLLSTYAYVDIVDDEDTSEDIHLAEDNITVEALDKLSEDDEAELPELSDYIGYLLDSKYPQLRGVGMSKIHSIWGVNDSNLDKAKEIISTEKEPYVLYWAIDGLSNEMKEPEVAEFIFRMADDDNAKLRRKAAMAIGNSWSKGVDGTVEKIIEMMNDKDDNVRAAACRNSGDLGDEAVIDPLVKILNNDEEADLHDECVYALVDLWYDYPFHENTSEKAYKATMDYLKKTPRTDKVPSWLAVGSFRTKTTDDEKFAEWQKKAKYYDTKEIYDVMLDIVKDENANWLGRTSAVEVIIEHCSDKQIQELKKEVEKLDGENADLVKSSAESKFESYEKDKNGD